MYFKFFISESWGKRVAIARSRFIQSFPKRRSGHGLFRSA